MTKAEALAWLKEHTLQYVAQCDVEALEIAIEVLERDVGGCEHCRGWDNRCGANYCPMCGRKLEEKK